MAGYRGRLLAQAQAEVCLILERFNPDIKAVNNPAWEWFRQHHLSLYGQAKTYLENLTGRRDLVVVDAASGAGYGHDFLQHFGCYIGLDASEEAVMQSHHARPNACYRICNLESAYDFCYMLHEQLADVIVSFETAEHLADPQHFLHIVASNLVAGGTLLFSAPTCLTRDFDRFHTHDFDMNQWRMMLYNAGFQILSITEVGFECSFAEFCYTVPTTLRQKLGIAGFCLLPWRWNYLANRLWNWIIRGRFIWTSHFFACRLADELPGLVR